MEEDICRTCLKSPTKLSSLYEDVKLMYKIETIASIELSNDPAYPTKICEECINNVNSLFNFRKLIIQSNKALTERLQEEYLKKEKAATEQYIKIEGDVEINNPIEYDSSPDEYLEETSENNTSEPDIAPHIKNETQEKTKVYECKECNKEFSSRFKMFNHRKLHTSKGVCNICGMVIRIDNLKRHILLHSETPVTCEVCGKIFKNSESLRSHKRIHMGITFTCEFCGRCFRVKSEYTRHLKAHSNPELGKVMCQVCGKKVRDIKRHKQSHTGEKPHKCTFCNKGFTSGYAVKVHTRQHTNEKPFICEFCPMAFPQKVSLVTHLKSKHNKDV